MSKFDTISGKKVIVLGGSTGMGLATAEGFLSRSCIVLIGSSSAAKIATAVEGLKKSYPKGKIDGKVVNLNEKKSIKEYLDWADVYEVKGIDHIGEASITVRLFRMVKWLIKSLDYPPVITAADSVPILALDTLDISAAQAAFNVRVFGVLTVVKHAKALFNMGGSLSLTIGAVAYKPIPGWSVAAAVNGSVEALVRGLALDLSPLRVNAICAGVVDTGLWDETFGNNEAAKKGFFDDQAQRLLTKAIGQPEDIAQAHMFTTSCKYLTGQIIVCDGGGTLI